jgi:hypothetical protein
MAITENQVFAALGLGARAQEPADPATPAAAIDNDPTPAGGEGANDQGVAAPAGEVTDPADPSNTEPTAGNADDDSGDEGGEAGAQTPEQRRANAARRRQQEQQLAIAEAVEAERKKWQQKSDADMADFFKQANLKNNFTGEPITNMDEFRAWQQQHLAERTKRGLESGKLTPEILNGLIDQHPVVQKAGEMVRRSEEETRKAQAAVAEAKVKEQLEQIRQLDPTIGTVEDLLKAPNAKEIYDLVKKGNSLVDAFRLANFDRLRSGAAEAARQQAVVNSRGKDHLQATGNSRGTGSASVPRDELAMYRLFNPGATEAQIQAHFNKNKN